MIESKEKGFYEFIASSQNGTHRITTLAELISTLDWLGNAGKIDLNQWKTATVKKII